MYSDYIRTLGILIVLELVLVLYVVILFVLGKKLIQSQ